MKKFLSLLLAVLMVVGVMVPMLTLFVGANDAETEETNTTDIPHLIITELVTNAESHHTVLAYQTNPDLMQPREIYWREVAVTVDETKVTSYFEKRDEDGVVSFIAATGHTVEKEEENGEITKLEGVAEAGHTYYTKQDISGDITEVIEYFEIYNAGKEAVNLYDYWLVKDADANQDGTALNYRELLGGPLYASAHGEYFQRAGTKEGVLADGFKKGETYYTKNVDDNGNITYVKVAAGAQPQAETDYYVCVAPGYYVENPEEAWLAPGETAVIWNYNENTWKSALTVENFISYHENRFSPKDEVTNPNGMADASEKIDLRNWKDPNDTTGALVIAMDSYTANLFGKLVGEAQGNATLTRSHSFWLDEYGQFNYGIIHDDMINVVEKDGKATVTGATDAERYEKWVSWAFWGSHAGIKNSSGTMELQSVTVGATTVTSGNFLVYDEATNDYYTPSVDRGTADGDGFAVAGVAYYKADLTNSDNDALANKQNGTAINYLYGLDSNASIKEGNAYTIHYRQPTPGLLTNTQKYVLPKYEAEVGYKTETPDIVITEVAPDSVGSDLYEFVEVVNTSGRAINMFDYSFVAAPDFRAYYNEYFKKINPIIPGDVGNILASNPGSYYYDTAPTNVNYESGWLQPGEVAVLWSYYTDTAKAGCTFDDFRTYYDMSNEVKLFAMDTDNSAYSGRSIRQNMANTGQYFYGLIENSNINWYGDVWTSNPVMEAIEFSSGVTASAYFGFDLDLCESFVICCVPFVSCTNESIGEDYAMQFVWNTIKGTNNKFGQYLDMARMTYYSGANKFAMSGTVATDEWKSSPGVLLDAQKTDITVNMGANRYVMYMQDFNGYKNVAGYDEVAKLVGITPVTNNSVLADEHMSNVKLTEKQGSSFLELRDGKLYVTNKGTSNDYMVLMSDQILKTMRDNFTIEYSMTYAANSTNGKDGYSAILYNFDGATLTYGAPLLRVSGYGTNAVAKNGKLTAIEDASGLYSIAQKSVAGENSNTLYERLAGKDIDSISGFSDSLQGSVMLAGKEMKVIVDVDRDTGVTITVNGIVVSSTYKTTRSLDFANWSLFLEETVGSDLALVTTPNISVAYDYITVYTDSLSVNADDMDIPSLYITELNVSGGTQIYRPNDTSTTNLDWIEYVELANGGTERVYLKDYVLLSTNKGNGGLLHDGNNLRWEGEDGNNVAFADWLGNGDYKANLSKKDGTVVSGDAGWYNPSENEAYLDPGEVALIFFVQDAKPFEQPNYDKKTVNLVDAACSWLKIDRSAYNAPLCMVVCDTNNTKVIDVEVDDNGEIIGTGETDTAPGGMCGYDTVCCTYGIGRAKDAEGKSINWKDVYTHDYRNLECLVNIVHSVMLGQDNTSYTSDTGSGGQFYAGGAGFSVHYVYGVDAGSHYKIGTHFTRRTNPIMDWYTSGTETKSKTGQYNVGKLYPYQYETFRDIQKLATDGYQDGGGLVITEYLYDTTGNGGADNGRDAFEALEITNTGSLPLNLYDYAYAASSDVNYGTATGKWTSLTKLRPGCPVDKTNIIYEQVKHIKNPEECIVEPGESVIVWVYADDARVYVNSNGTPLTVDDFRNHYAAIGNTKITEKDRFGDYTVKIVMAAYNANNGSGNLTNTLAARAYGIAKTTNMDYSGVIRGSSIVSSFVHSEYPAYYDLRWVRQQLTSNTHTANSGTSVVLTGAFNWDHRLAELVDFETDTELTNLCTKNRDGTYAFATEPYDQTREHYRLYFYWSKQSFRANHKLSDVSFQFVYGNSMTSGWDKGAMISTVKVAQNSQSGSNRMGIVAEAASWNSRISIDVISTGIYQNSLGYLLEEQQCMLAHSQFNFAGTNKDGLNIYLHKSITGDVENVVVSNTESSVSTSGETSISYGASVNNTYYSNLVLRFGADNVDLGFVIVRAELLEDGYIVRPERFDKDDCIVYDGEISTRSANGIRYFNSNSVAMDGGYYTTTYASVGYISFTSQVFGEVTLYAETAKMQSATQVLTSAVVDYKSTPDEVYKYQIAEGKYSRYTAEQIVRIQELLATQVGY